MAAANIVGNVVGRQGDDGDAHGASAVAGLPVRYTIEQRLGGGGSGETFAALDSAPGGSGAACVVKVFASAAGGRAAALGEYRELARVVHPSVVRVRDIGRLLDGRLFVVTDRVVGPGIESIATIADDDRRRAALEGVARDLAGALAHLHGRGIVHGDVTPGNVRLDAPDAASAAAHAVLIDFGLAGPPLPGDGTARGTLGYAAPEALTGARTPACDLFGLGATLFEAWSGAAPFGRGLAAAQRILGGAAPRLSAVRPGLGDGWDDLVARLLAVDPAARPRSAREVLRALARLTAGPDTPTEVDLAAPYPEGDPVDGIVVGRRAERAALRASMERLSEGAARATALLLVGPVGSGRRTLFELVAREVAVAAAAGVMPPIDLWRGDRRALEAWLGLPAAVVAPGADPQRTADARMAALADALETRASERPVCVWLEGGPDEEAFARFWSGAPPSGRALVAMAATSAPAGAGFVETVVLAPLAEGEIAALLRAADDDQPAPDAVVETIARVSQGNAAIAALLARRHIAERRAGRATDVAAIAGDQDALDALLDQGAAALDADAQALLAAIALGDAAAGEAEASFAARAAATRAGWLAARADGVALPSAAHRAAVLRVVPAEVRRRIAARVLDQLAPDDERRADALEQLGRLAEASSFLCRSGAAALAAGRGIAAALLFGRADALAPGSLAIDQRLALVTGLALLGRIDDAAREMAQANAAAAGADGSTRAACREREAWLRSRRGDLDGARTALETALAEDGGLQPAATTLRTRLARLLVSMGRFRDALTLVDPLPTAPAADAALATETATLAHAYLGELPAARERLRALEAVGAGTAGRRAYLAALVAQLGGVEKEALAAYRDALAVASREGDVHTVATVALNLGGMLMDHGIYGEALAVSERAVRELGRLGAAELATALVNTANLFVQVGDLPAARRALARARAGASASHVALALAPAQFVEGDLAQRAGDPRAAAALYRAAATAFEKAGQAATAGAALYSACEALVAGARPDEAAGAFAAAEQLGTSARDGGVAAARARAALALAGHADGDPPAALAAGLESVARTVQSDGRRATAWRLMALSARLYDRAGDGARAAAARALGRSIFEEVRMSVPEPQRSTFAQDPDARWLASDEAAAAVDGASAARAAAAESRLRRLLRINKRLNSELRLPRLLEMIVDTVIELTDAERGFVLLEDEAGELGVKVARNIDQRTLETEELALSRSIARQAAVGGEPIVTIDASGDARFREAMSVSDLHLRSVLAVPLAVKGRAVGTIYVDHRLRKGAFDQEDVRLVQDFAEQAAIALENARLLGELRRRERQVEALNRRLETELAARREELAGVKQELRENREALAVRYDYRNIIGRTPRMIELFRLLDRITDTALPVVVQGESGTGKELVARAIHTNGPRRERPFVGENCAAIPETLLESTLFGYVRGAFTGAEHDKRGLFEIADGGTLFLDEVGEMSPAMQGKLLRVLQEGELRRVGSERTRKIDVRVVAATNRDLARMVDEGKFRRDLFFRLSVVTIALPPLRDRRDDIPLMVAHFLDAHAKAAGRAAPKPIDAAALARLCAYRWPGNVRELENELTRADALSGARITLADLSPQVAAAGDSGAAAAADPDNLMLKPRVERLERSLLREALGRSGNNQTKAAELLGLSRFGLQKKLKRYNFNV